MYFLIFSVFLIFYAKTYEISSDRFSSLILFLLLVSLYSFLPALQYEVGTDYNSYYQSVYKDSKSSVFFNKGEFLFHYLIEFIEALSLHQQFIFVFSGIIQGALFVNILRVFRRQGYSISLIAFLFIVVTGIYHNQLNGLRNYIAILSFVNLCLYSAENKYIKSIIIAIFGALFHQSFLLAVICTLPIILFKHKIYKNIFLVYLLSFLVFASGTPMLILENLINIFAPFYAHYLNYESSVSALNIATRAIYVPIALVFFWYFYKVLKKKGLSDFDKAILSIWAVSANLFFLLIYWGPFFRLIGYFSFFSIVPIYFVLRSKEINKEMRYIILLLLIASYIPKVTFFAEGEYSYSSIIQSSLKSHDPP
ncbi:EpsG family protein [Idiomarina sp. HB]|uniref:EpsG family protein n=1 Tax=Idiomarina sp. HB TaxID=3110479 RepID=UPI003A81118E